MCLLYPQGLMTIDIQQYQKYLNLNSANLAGIYCKFHSIFEMQSDIKIYNFIFKLNISSLLVYEYFIGLLVYFQYIPIYFIKIF